VKKPTPFGKYYLLERINVGGMAEVFRAKAFGVEGFERLVAVKRILPNIAEDKDFIRMFVDEAKLAVQLNHANIAQIFDLGVVDASYYIALEHIHGRDLRAIFDRSRQLGEPMPVSQACFIVMKACEGLDYAHNKRDQSGRELHLVHRDVSPQNILVSFEGEVKLIDFGIAKAAGKGSKTQAGILKGKFGYMSPEQVRGIPIDRRSDVFSCGIVLYELLTGERLFVGESDFSTLEKVRNVEILPPSTYNRRIPDELERIVLKALAKDPEERYQNAIDLHDELQAFVYTAGEFYSRKDLAGWMKKTFGREIEEESAKLEGYRQLKPPPELATPPPRAPSGTRPPAPNQTAPVRKSSEGIRTAQATKPPPPPSLPAGARGSGPVSTKDRRADDSLSWDEDELETQIYDDPIDPKTERQRGLKPAPVSAEPSMPPAPQPTVSRPTGPTARPPTLPPPVPPPPTPAGPDLSSLVSAAARPPTLPPPVPPPPTPAGPDLSSLVSAAQSWEAVPANPNPSATLRGVLPNSANGAALGAPAPALDRSVEPSSPVFPARVDTEPVFDSVPGFGANVLKRETRVSRTPIVAIAAAAAAVIVVVVVIAKTGGKKTQSAEAKPGSASGAPVDGDPSTGFDLYVSPSGVSTWRLDDAVRNDRLPARIRRLAPGPHQVAIEAPPGYRSVTKTVTVEAGQAPRVNIPLEPVVINAQFDTTPEGASVSLIVDGKREPIGFAPAKAQLDPQKSYQVLFERPGYWSKNQPITFSGTDTEQITVALQPTNSPAVAPVSPGPVTSPPSTTPKGDALRAVSTPRNDTAARPDAPRVTHASSGSKATPSVASAGDDSKGGGQGILKLTSKPPCEIFIDGSDSGKRTPQPNIPLDVGRHTITLVNDDFGIKDTFSVDIKADVPDLEKKDYSSKLPQQ
jgi:serine/threonine protein kinase